MPSVTSCRRSSLALALLTAGCISVDVGKDTPQQAQFRIIDGNAAPQPAARSTGRDLVIAPQPSAVRRRLILACLFARAESARCLPVRHVERPSVDSPRQLLVDRIAARRAFTSVALAGRGVAGDLQLNLTVNDFFHDAASSPGTARVEVSAEMIDRTTRKLIARQSFSASAPVAQANSAAAAAALGVASSRVLDQLVAWVESHAIPAALASAR